ncbi:ribonuclease BN (tRNA processing enzyme) [Herbihabitans rhizosphaerae]|uniref:Ribonuclease BN (tRNA processing enzyme) n=1 Tax=Herbihabitans rhizosphaerae TaxID=1872711 RepID=A0A4Q7KHQ4_9PSEU|nr:MBL fold metallo-hydrolase [Herbihabitans rhizosphaerae]RZS34084.1 ribonuclease BN (tRNA processing enzyme) [Herbihabitans rhizosphaerae]
MLLTVLGCSGSAPGPNAPASGYLLEAEGFTLALELGNGTLAELMALRDPLTVDAMLFSHLHPDHCADFSALTVLRRYHPEPSRDPRANRLPVFAPKEAPNRLVAAYSPDEADRLVTDLSDVYSFTPLDHGTVHIGPFEVTAVSAPHPCEAFSFRIVHNGRSLVYTGDTGWNDPLVDLSSTVDVLLSEASWTHAEGRPPDLHLSGREAGELASRAGVGRLLVTHVPPWTDADAVLAEARGAFDDGVELVRRGASYTI